MAVTNQKQKSIRQLVAKDKMTAEEEFLHASEVGDLPTVSRLLQSCPGLNVNCTDLMGRTPLRLAAGNEHVEVVELLIGKSEHRHIYDSLLHSIKTDLEEISVLILNHPKYPDVRHECEVLPAQNPTLYKETSSQFSSEITPIILAAQYNRFETLMLLIQRGESIPEPHAYNCTCDECTSSVKCDELKFAKTRLSRFLGLASEAYISLVSRDPILTSFQLARDLRKVADREKYYRNEYLTLADKLGDYGVQLLDNVRGNEELDIILNASEGSIVDLACFGKLARLKLAIHYEQKKFIAHPACQKKLMTTMYGDLSWLTYASWPVQLLVLLSTLVIYPLLAVAYLIIPHWVGRLIKTPVIKFWAHTLSYLLFLTTIMTFSFTERDIQLKQTTLGSFPGVNSWVSLYKPELENMIVRPHCVNHYLMFILLYVISMVWQECKQIYNEGLEGYLDSIFNWIDFFLLQFYLASFALRYITVFKVANAIKYFERRESWEELVHDSNGPAMTNLYWLTADRLYWDQYDPQNVCEGLFALANVFSFCRLSYLLAIHEALGPLQISLGLMIKDVLRFTLIFMLFVIAFFVGLHNLYWFYNEEVLSHTALSSERGTLAAPAIAAFGSVTCSLKTVFWALFGMTDSDVTELAGYHNYFTETVGLFLFAIYNWITVIVVLNMLIALMSKSFDDVTGDQDVEWKFALTNLYMDYIKDFSSLPPPFNIIPSPKSVLRLLCRILGRRNNAVKDKPTDGRDTTDRTDRKATAVDSKIENVTRGNARPSSSIFRQDLDIALSEGSKYKTVIRRVVGRYIEQKITLSSIVSNEEIKQDLSSFRYEILSTMQQSQNCTTTCGRSLDVMIDRQGRLENSVDQLPTDVYQPQSCTTTCGRSLDFMIDRQGRLENSVDQLTAEAHQPQSCTTTCGRSLDVMIDRQGRLENSVDQLPTDVHQPQSCTTTCGRSLDVMIDRQGRLENSVDQLTAEVHQLLSWLRDGAENRLSVSEREQPLRPTDSEGATVESLTVV